jgi:hypothetical protein
MVERRGEHMGDFHSRRLCGIHERVEQGIVDCDRRPAHPGACGGVHLELSTLKHRQSLRRDYLGRNLRGSGHDNANQQCQAKFRVESPRESVPYTD